MGVVRDITVEQLAQAVGSIDTSGLAKDTTLQATNTALGNINTTLGGITTNDPPTDTTQQSIASAISGLGQTLGSDRALIDGSNIANPSAFRNNIGLNIHTETYTGTTNRQSLLTTNIPWTGQFLGAYATITSSSTRVFAIGHRPSGGGYIVSKLITDSGGAVAEVQVTLTITIID